MSAGVLKLRYQGRCCRCGKLLDRNTRAHYDQVLRLVTCPECGAACDKQRETRESLPEQALAKPPGVLGESGSPGASAQREYERRHAKRDKNINKRYGRLAPLVKLVSDDPQTTKAWAQGARGEEKLAAFLAEKLDDRFRLLHDRRIPRSGGNIDHIVVGPSGIWVVDAKDYKGKLERIDKGGWFRTDYRFCVGGRDRTKAVLGAHKQAEVVRSVSGVGEVSVRSALCLVDGDWGIFQKPFQVDGVWIIWPRKLCELISSENLISARAVQALSDLLQIALPPMVK